MKDVEKTLIMKFGGAAFASPESFTKIASVIEAKRAHFAHLVVVVSAMQGMTDQLIGMAKLVHSDPPRREYDMLLSAGERISMALLAMALDDRKIDAVSFTGSQSGIITSEDHTEATILEVRPDRLKESLKSKVVIVAGFQGVSKKKEITTLGRGGSDTTAVALGIALQAERVEFYKDVPGIFEQDPKKNGQAQKFSTLSYREALEVVRKTGKVLHPRALILAEKNRLPLFVRSFHKGEEEGTYITDNAHSVSALPIYE